MSKPLILVVEDDVPVRNLITITLKTHGYRYLTAGTGDGAVVEASSHNPDVVLLDVKMPVMDGLSATRVIRVLDREDAKTIPIIAMTANAFEEDAKRCLAAGMTAHLAKPFQIEDVEKAIVECCGK